MKKLGDICKDFYHRKIINKQNAYKIIKTDGEVNVAKNIHYWTKGSLFPGSIRINDLISKKRLIIPAHSIKEIELITFLEVEYLCKPEDKNKKPVTYICYFDVPAGMEYDFSYIGKDPLYWKLKN